MGRKQKKIALRRAAAAAADAAALAADADPAPAAVVAAGPAYFAAAAADAAAADADPALAADADPAPAAAIAAGPMRVNVTLNSDDYIIQIRQAIDGNEHNTILFHLADGEDLRPNVINGINREVAARNREHTRNDSFSLDYLVPIINSQLQGFDKKINDWVNNRKK
ncbi:hypothetical protein L195_g033170 [Trifolium pratense]|uniref:Uncharacterized protein n=1 Tax=Trifolium pratense TaxID=57577 RepID=A0A2K3LFB4_TRIPR|nr:hypothetical protein L195_g033170 [Trifolium pratense]